MQFVIYVSVFNFLQQSLSLLLRTFAALSKSTTFDFSLCGHLLKICIMVVACPLISIWIKKKSYAKMQFLWAMVFSCFSATTLSTLFFFLALFFGLVCILSSYFVHARHLCMNIAVGMKPYFELMSKYNTPSYIVNA